MQTVVIGNILKLRLSLSLSTRANKFPLLCTSNRINNKCYFLIVKFKSGKLRTLWSIQMTLLFGIFKTEFELCKNSELKNARKNV